MPLSKEEKGKEEGGQREQASGGCRPPTDEREGGGGGGGGNFTLQTPSSFFSFPLPPVGVASPPLSPVSGRVGEGEEATPPHSSISQVLDLGPKGGERKEQSFAGRKKREGENQEATFTFPLAAESGKSGERNIPLKTHVFSVF